MLRVADRRLSRKKSVMALDRLKRTFSFQPSVSPSGSFSSGTGGSTRNLAASDPSDATITEVDVTIEKPTARRAPSNTIPETIPEEEAERIRRESLKPVNGDVARQDSIDGDLDGEESVGKEGRGKEEEEGGTESPGSKQKRDEGLGESFDRNSELSDRDSVSRNSSNVVEMQPLGDSGSGGGKQPPSADLPPTSYDSSTGGQGASPEDPRLSFLDSSASKKVTFM